MKVSDIIKTFQQYSDPDQEIIITWWEKDSYEDFFGRPISNLAWRQAEEDLMNMDWGDADQVIIDSLERNIPTTKNKNHLPKKS